MHDTLTRLGAVLSCASKTPLSVIAFNEFTSSIEGRVESRGDIVRRRLIAEGGLRRLGCRLVVGQRGAQVCSVLIIIIFIKMLISLAFCVHGEQGHLTRTRRHVSTLAHLLRSTRGMSSGRRRGDNTFFGGLLLRRLNVVQLITGAPASRGRTLLGLVSNVNGGRVPIRKLLT